MLLVDKMIGRKFSRLTIIEILPDRTKDRKVRVLCRCDCGAEKIAILTLLKQNIVKSCGCLKAANARLNGKLAIPIMIERGEWNADPSLSSAKQTYIRYSDGDISFDKFLEISQQDCYYCGQAPNNNSNAFRVRKTHKYSQFRIDNGNFRYNGLDRVDNDKGHTLNNVVPCCVFCNKAKLNRSKEEFFAWVERVHARHCS